LSEFPTSSIPAGHPSFEELSRTLFEITAADQFFIYRCNEPAGAMEPVGSLEPVFALGSLSLPEKQAFWASQVDSKENWLSGAPQMIALGTEMERARFDQPIFQKLRSRSLLIYPISSRDRLLGLALIGWLADPAPLSEKDWRLAGVTAHALALEIDNQRLVDLDHRQQQEARISQEILQGIQRRDDLTGLLQFIAGEGMRATDALGCAIWLVDDDGSVQIAAQVGKAVPEEVLPLSSTEIQSMQTEPITASIETGPHSEQERGLVRVVPLLSGGKTLGVLELYQIEAYAQSKDLEVARSFAGQAAVAVELARLYQRLLHTAVAEERARLARDLHDSVSQSLYAMTLYTRAAQRRLSEGNLAAVEKHIQELHATAREALGEMRMLIFELRPMALERYGLKGILEQRLKSVEERSGLETALEVDLPAGLPPVLEDNLYHIAIEALNNTIKHASASRVTLSLQYDSASVRLTIQDNGAGFNPDDPQGGLGLKNIQERAAALGGRAAIQSAPGAGASIFVEIPYANHSNPDC
jgi:signal transduction histidine kinase